MTSFIRHCGYLLAVVVILNMSGCIPIPIPSLGYPTESRTNLPDRVPEFIVKGKTTREQVLLTLGTPDSYAADGRWMAYTSARHAGGVAFIVGGGYTAGVVGPISSHENRLLVVRFDTNSVVIDAAFEHRSCLTATDVDCPVAPQLSVDSTPQLSDLTKIYVAISEADPRGINHLILAELHSRGLEATSGPADAAPADADAVVTYRAMWEGEGTVELANLTASVREPGSDRELATAAAVQTPRTPKAPSDMVGEIVGTLFTQPEGTFLTLSPYASTAEPTRLAPLRGGTVYVESVQDARSVARGKLIGERSAPLGISMGKIDMSPSPAAMVRQLLVTELANLGYRSVRAGAHITIDTQLIRFDVETPATLLYWDVNGVIAIDVGVKRGHDEKRLFQYVATCTDRTYLWPSQSMVKGVVSECLTSLGTRVREDRALSQLLAVD